MVSETIVLGITIPAYVTVTIEGESQDDIRSWTAKLVETQDLLPIGDVMFKPEWEFWDDLRVVNCDYLNPEESCPVIKVPTEETN